MTTDGNGNEMNPSFTPATITVKTPVTAGFTFANNNLKATFTDTSNGGVINSWVWDFGDGIGTSSIENPDYTYAKSGTYLVNLTVTNTDGSTNSITQPIVVVAAAPVAVLDVSPVNGIAPLDVAIADNSTGEIVSRVLYVDDVIADTVLDHYNFTTVGKHTLKLSVTNVGGGNTDIKTIDVYEPAVPSFTLDKNSGKVPFTVTATCTVPKVEGCTDVCNWLNDIGEAKLGENVTYTFSDAGDHNIKMQFIRTYPNGQTVEFDSEPQFIKALPLEPPVPGILMNPVSGNGEIPLKVIFTSTATGATTTSWDFGDQDSSENTATGDVVSHSYDKVGTYTVTQTATNDDGSATTTATVNTIHTPVPPIQQFPF
jgi:PKD repeat protein